MLERAAAYAALREWSDAVDDYTAILARDAENQDVLLRRAAAYNSLDDWSNAADDYNRVIELQPENWSAFKWRGNSRANFKEWKTAASDFQTAIRIRVNQKKSAEQVLYHWLALVSLAEENQTQYSKVCGDLLERYGKSSDASVANSIAWTCSIGPEAVADFEDVLSLAKTAAGKNPTHAVLNTLGAAYYRAGKYETAIEKLSKGIELQGKDGVAMDWLFLAMSHARLGQQKTAENWLTRAGNYIEGEDAKPNERPAGYQDLSWPLQLELTLVFREAKKIVSAEKRK